MSRSLLGVIFFFILMVSFAVAGFLYLQFRAPFSGDAFDAPRWRAAAAGQAAPGGKDCGRCTMVNDLVEKHLPGDRDAVRALLGAPDKTDQKAREETRCDAFRLGLDLRLSAMWNEAWLYVCYAPTNAVKKAFPLVF